MSILDTLDSDHLVPETDDTFRSGFFALVGRPNVGKSTLLNACMGQKLAITSSVPQTTRRRMRAVLTDETSQIVLVDTPGLHKPQDRLGQELNRSALMELSDADGVVLVIDATQEVGRGDAWIIDHIVQTKPPCAILVISKADRANQNQIEAQIAVVSRLYTFDDVVVVSSRKNFNIDTFLKVITSHLEPGPQWFSEDDIVDMDIQDLVAEFVREKLLYNLRDELPHTIGVQCTQLLRPRPGHTSCDVSIFVERDAHKAIVIGKGGSLLKKVGISARKDLETLLETSVYLDITVKVAPQWRRDLRQITRFGYGAQVD